MKVNVMMSYPDAMRRDIEKRGMEWWAKGGEYQSFADAIGVAQSVANERNFPIQIKCLGQKMTVYPKKLREMGY